MFQDSLLGWWICGVVRFGVGGICVGGSWRYQKYSKRKTRKNTGYRRKRKETSMLGVLLRLKNSLSKIEESWFQ